MKKRKGKKKPIMKKAVSKGKSALKAKAEKPVKSPKVLALVLPTPPPSLAPAVVPSFTVKPIKRRRRRSIQQPTMVLTSVTVVSGSGDFMSVTVTSGSLAPAEPEKPKKPSTRMYFHAGTQAAIVKFQTLADPKEREKLYVAEIMPAFEKLAENLINIHKFTSLHDTFDDLKNDAVNFLFETIRKFDANRGTNAFSYFNICCKNFLIIRTKQKIQRMKRAVSLDDPDNLTVNENRIIEDHCTVPSQDILVEHRSTAKGIVNMLHEIRSKAKTENELVACNSIITIFENINDVDMLNKSAILVYMRELSGLSPKQLTTALQNVKRQYRRIKSEPGFDLF